MLLLLLTTLVVHIHKLVSCVCLCVRTVTFKLYDRYLWHRYLSC